MCMAIWGRYPYLLVKIVVNQNHYNLHDGALQDEASAETSDIFSIFASGVTS